MYMNKDLRKQIGQQMLIGISGKSLTESEKKFIVENNIGGVVLFGRNVEEPKQIYDLTNEIQSLRNQMMSDVPLIVGIDMEGGRVARLKAPFTTWPPMANLGEIDSPSLAFKFAQSMGEELKAVGINLNFAPCVDVLTNPANELIGDRSFSDDPEIVGKIGSAVVRGFLKASIIPCAKHFPGHGNTIIDSHEDLPVEEVDFERLNEIELNPFKKAFRARVDMVMTAHMKFPKIDPDWPVTLSEKFIKEILRDTGYKKIVITDDLDMKALANNYDKEFIPVQALKAGCNMLLYCNEPDSPPIALDAVEKAVKDNVISEETILSNMDLVHSLKKERLRDSDPLDFEEVSRIVGHPEHLQLSKAIRDKEIPADINT